MSQNEHPRFPRIREYIRENELSTQQFLEEIGDVISPNTYFLYQRGEVDPSYRFIRAVIEETMMPFEEAFKERK